MPNQPSSPKYPNLYQEVFVLNINNQHHKSEELLIRLLREDPEQPEIILSWTELHCLTHKQKLVAPLIKDLQKRFPENPYYKIAACHIMMADQKDARLLNDPKEATALIDAIVKTGLSACESRDALAKTGMLAITAGFWECAVAAFAQSFLTKDSPLDLFPLNDSDTFNEWLDEIRRMNFTSDLNSLPLSIVAKAGLILLLAHEEGIPEAWLALTILSAANKKLTKAYRDQALPQFIAKHALGILPSALVKYRLSNATLH